MPASIISQARSGLRRLHAAMLQWRVDHVSNNTFAMMLAVIVGLCAGLCAFALKILVSGVSSMLTAGLDPSHFNLVFLVLPVAGILFTGIYTRYVLRENIEHGAAIVERDLRNGVSNLSPRLIYSPLIASTFTLGFGGSAGSEGPIATCGSAIGSNVGRIFGLPPQLLTIMIGCGAGAAIAGIFKAPIGGMLFTLEVLRLEMSTVAVMSLVLACMVAAMTAYGCSGCIYDVDFIKYSPFDPSILPYVLLLGVFCGAYSIYYSFTGRKVGHFLAGIANPWLKNLASGAMLAVMIFLFPTLYGEGYDSITHVINGEWGAMVNNSFFHSFADRPWVLIVVVVGVLLCKGGAATATTSGGGVAGDFAPTLFAGAMAGFLFAELPNTLFHLHLPVTNFAFIGMAGVMAGVIKAPLMAVFLVAEMAGAYQFFLPLMIVAVVSYGVVYFYARWRSHEPLLSPVDDDSQ